MKKILFLVGFALLLGLTAMYARGKDEKITGIYSNLLYHEEAGDVLGQEAFIFYTQKGYYILFQQSEGEPGMPVLIPATIENRKVAFTVPDDVFGYTGEFKGEIRDGWLIGHFNVKGEPRTIKLKRKNSYWQ